MNYKNSLKSVIDSLFNEKDEFLSIISDESLCREIYIRHALWLLSFWSDEPDYTEIKDIDDLFRKELSGDTVTDKEFDKAARACARAVLRYDHRDEYSASVMKCGECLIRFVGDLSSYANDAHISYARQVKNLINLM